MRTEGVISEILTAFRMWQIKVNFERTKIQFKSIRLDIFFRNVDVSEDIKLMVEV